MGYRSHKFFVAVAIITAVGYDYGELDWQALPIQLPTSILSVLTFTKEV